MTLLETDLSRYERKLESGTYARKDIRIAQDNITGTGAFPKKFPSCS